MRWVQGVDLWYNQTTGMGRPQNCRIVILQRFTHRSEGPELHIRLKPRALALGSWTLRAFVLKAWVPQDWGNRDFTLKQGTQNPTYTRTQGKSYHLMGGWARPTCWSCRVSQRSEMRLWLILGRKTLGPDILKNTQLYEHSWQLPYWLISAKTWPHPTPVGSGASHSMAGLQACKVRLPPWCLAFRFCLEDF